MSTEKGAAGDDSKISSTGEPYPTPAETRSEPRVLKFVGSATFPSVLVGNCGEREVFVWGTGGKRVGEGFDHLIL